MKWHIRRPESTSVNPKSYCGKVEVSDVANIPLLVDIKLIERGKLRSVCRRCREIHDTEAREAAKDTPF